MKSKIILHHRSKYIAMVALFAAPVIYSETNYKTLAIWSLVIGVCAAIDAIANGTIVSIEDKSK